MRSTPRTATVHAVHACASCVLNWWVARALRRLGFMARELELGRGFNVRGSRLEACWCAISCQVECLGCMVEVGRTSFCIARSSHSQLRTLEYVDGVPELPGRLREQQAMVTLSPQGHHTSLGSLRNKAAFLDPGKSTELVRLEDTSLAGLRQPSSRL